MIAHGAGPDAQRLPVGVLRAGGHARAARGHRACAGSCRWWRRSSRSAGGPMVRRPPGLLQPVLARAGHRLDRRVHHRLPGSPLMDERDAAPRSSRPTHETPGDAPDWRSGLLKAAAGPGRVHRADAGVVLGRGHARSCGGRACRCCWRRWPSARWACTSCSSCTSPAARKAPTPSWRWPSACSSWRWSCSAR